MRNARPLAGVAWAVLVIAVAWGPAGAGAAAPAALDQFDGTWKVTVTSDDGGKGYDDVLTFKSNKFSSQALKARGFGEVEYEADVRGGQAATFIAAQKAAKGGEAKWTGTAVVGELNGTLKVTDAAGTEKTYSYKGTREKK